MPPDLHLTNPILWACTCILLVLDVLLAVLARQRIIHEQFQSMRRTLTFSSGIFFLLVWLSVLIWAWDWFYAYIFPPWARYALPLIFGVAYTIVAWLMSWLSLKLPGSPAVTWIVLGGVEGLLSHLYAIFGLGAASRPPIMQGTDPYVVLIFAIFEKAFYWSLILLISTFIFGKFSARRNQDSIQTGNS